MTTVTMPVMLIRLLRFMNSLLNWMIVHLRRTMLLVTIASLTACAAGPHVDPRDPMEKFNRDMTEFNEVVDGVVMKPVATAYTETTPYFIRTAVRNFFGNLRDVWSTLNTAMQLRVEDTVVNALRVGLNTLWGFGGIVDIASEMHLYRSPADFGQTLGRWGVPPGPYLVLPIFGPSTVRDTVGMGVEARGDLVMGLDNVANRNLLQGLRAVETRAGLLRASSVLDDAALDKYTFTREVFLQRRKSIIDAQRNRNDDD
jgi:phospholipid-binding lipoprotein MlaA